MNLSAAYLPQSWQKGEGLQEIVDLVGNLWNNIVVNGSNLLNKFANFLQRQINDFSDIPLSDWIKTEPSSESPVATGAALLATGGVIMLVGGQIVSLIGGGISAIWRLTQLAANVIGLGGLVRAAVGGVQRIWNFNFQITDKEVKAKQKSLIEGQAGVWGEALGSMLGTLCGFSLGRVAYAAQADLIRFNPDLIAKLDELRINNFDKDSELWEEALQNLQSAIASSTRAATNIAGLEAYVNIRKAVKAIARGVNLSAIMPGLGKMIETWGEEGQKPWSFASAQEEWIESLPDGAIQNFAEEFIEAAQDMCAESSIQVSYAL